VRRPPGIVVFSLALLGGILAAGGWIQWIRGEAPVADGSAPPPATVGPSAPTMPAAHRPRTATRPATTPATDEELLAGIRAKVRSDPEQAESLAREARTRFPNSPHADEWDAALVDALVNQQRIGAARSEAYYYYDHHPGGRFAAHLFALTGVHPMPIGTGAH
jgi:cytochrome c-type biogenesis protein CcmH/NrfG